MEELSVFSSMTAITAPLSDDVFWSLLNWRTAAALTRFSPVFRVDLAVEEEEEELEDDPPVPLMPPDVP